MRARIGALLAAAIVASCSAPAATPVVSPTPMASPTALPSAVPTATAEPGASQAPGGPAQWLDAGTMSIGRQTTHAVLLGDGRVLVVGNDETGCVRSDSVMVDIWDPVSGSWSAARSLNKPRGGLAAVALIDGRALVTAGLNAGVTEDWGQSGNEAYSSTYIYDPLDPAAGWTRAGLLANARVAPAASVLPDGRVLVAGGYYQSGGTGRAQDSTPGVVLAGYRPDATGDSSSRGFFDVDPGPYIPALATAELYDPTTDTWSRTGPLRYARIGAQAVTLADGRVLVVGSETVGGTAAGPWNGWTRIDDRAPTTSEIYDPATGRFSLSEDMPGIDWTLVSALGLSGVDQYRPILSAGTLIALSDGGALLAGHATGWYASTGDYEGEVVRTLRFDPATDSWTQVDQRVVGHRTIGDPPDPWAERVPGRSRAEALVALLPDGRVLLAGGLDPVTRGVSAEADLYDPAADSWTALPPMPESRAWGAAVTLTDGSVLLVGGHWTTGGSGDCGAGTTGLATAVRFVPGS